MKLYQLMFVLVLQPAIANSQSLAVNTDGSTAHPNALVDIKGINKGLLIPRGDAATRTALNTNTAKGLLMYDTVLNTVWLHNGNGLATGWNSLATGTNHWQLNGALGTEIKNTNTGGFWSANATTVLADPGTIQPPVSGAGTRFMWMPQKSAFRLGTVTGSNWNADSIGLYSFAAGVDVKAKGIASIALGDRTLAEGTISTAIGSLSNAVGYGSIAIGQFSSALTLGSIAIGNTAESSGLSAISLGDHAFARGTQSLAMGFNADAFGFGSLAIGTGVTSVGIYSTSLGYQTASAGNYSGAWGHSTNSSSYASHAIGRFNDTIAGISRTAWVATDPLFYIGNGSNSLALSNALVVYKNGNTDISGYTQLGKPTDGAPAIKMKKLTTTSASSQGGLVTVAHGLSRAKILGVQVLLTYLAGAADIPGPYLDVPGYEYNWQVNNTDINIYNKTGNSINILSKPIRILITYEE